jgi:hypothetical protein
MAAVSEPPRVAVIREACLCGGDHCACRRGPNVHCPAHDDRNPSLSLTLGRNGAPVVKCHTGCDQGAVIAALQRLGVWPSVNVNGTNGHHPLRELPQPDRAPVAPLPLERLAATYEYRDAGGRLVAVKARFEAPPDKKRFAWRLPASERWDGLHGIPMTDIPLWGAELLRDADPQKPVIITEGEKAAQACRDHGLLALTFGGGASTKEWGAALDVLRGRVVVLWPDNDEAGRLYMARLRSALAGIAAKVITVDPPNPPKGDAFEYFAAGGTADALLSHAPPETTAVDYLAHDAVRVRVPTGMGVVSFTFVEMEKSSRELSAELEVRLEGPGHDGEPFARRINLLSSSQCTELRRDLEAVYGKGDHWKWPAIVNTAVNRARAAYVDQDRAVRLRDIPEAGEVEYLINPIVPAGSPVVLFADGSSGKSYLSMRWAIAVAGGPPFPGMPTRRGPVLFIDYEDTAEAFKFRINRLLAAADCDPDALDLPIHYWNARGIPLPDQIDAIRRKVERDGIVFVIVDAAADACGGEPEKAEIALRYFNALSRLPDGVATLTIAHVTNIAAKNGADRPFGSAYWHNRPRRTWTVVRVQEEESDIVDIGLYCKKTNDSRKPKPLGLRLTFTATGGPVLIEPSELALVPELEARRPIKSRIYDLLKREGWLTIGQIAEETGEKPGTIGVMLRRERALFVMQPASTQLGGRGHPARWGVLAREATP